MVFTLTCGTVNLQPPSTILLMFVSEVLLYFGGMSCILQGNMIYIYILEPIWLEVNLVVYIDILELIRRLGLLPDLHQSHITTQRFEEERSSNLFGRKEKVRLACKLGTSPV